MHKKELLFLLLVNRTEWPPITKAPLTKIQFRRLWDLVSKRQAKERVYYRYINGVKTPFKVEAKLGEKSKHGNCVYSIVRHPGAIVVDFLVSCRRSRPLSKRAPPPDFDLCLPLGISHQLHSPRLFGRSGRTTKLTSAICSIRASASCASLYSSSSRYRGMT